MEYISALSRWIHIVAGILWIGMLYFFNFVNGPLAATYDAETKKKVVPQLMPRALFWFRFGAAFTWVTGVLLLMMVFYHGGVMFEGEQSWHGGAFVMLAVTFLGVFVYDLIFSKVKAQHPMGIIVASLGVLLVVLGYVYLGKFSYRAYVMHLGAMFGTIMAYNVWFRIWPAQKQIITAIRDGQAPNTDLVALAGLRSKHNTYMSVPLVWTMINQHSALSFSGHFVSLLIIVAVGWMGVKHLYKASTKVTGF